MKMFKLTTAVATVVAYILSTVTIDILTAAKTTFERLGELVVSLPSLLSV